MLQTTIPAYPYVQYADDDNIQAFFAAYNGAAQYYVTWFATIGLPYYPGLTDGLLDWVAEGLYGLARTALQSQFTAALGPLNTVPLNAPGFPYNTYVFPTANYFSLSDDVLGRILTWDFFKGDGKRFNARWLKRRIMRFLSWPNGAPPPAGTVGPENTQAIGVVISAGVCTVTLNQSFLSVLVPSLPPNILPIFQAAFQGGNLELPAQYTYVCNIQVHPNATATPASVSASAATATIITPTVKISVTGGSGQYVYSFVWQSGGTGITINPLPTQGTVNFIGNGLTPGTTFTGIALCIVTDTLTSQTAQCQIPVTISRPTQPTVSVAPASISVTGISSTESASVTSVTPAGGVGPYTYLWSWQSGGAGITIGSPNSAITAFTSTGMAPGQTNSGVALLTVFDSLGQSGTTTLPVSLSRSNALNATVAPGSISYTNIQTVETTPSATVTPAGGTAPYTYGWAWQSGGTGIAINSPSSATTTFTATNLAAPGAAVSGTAVCTVTDALGQTFNVTLPVTINRATQLHASASPASQSSIALSITQTTGSSTVIGSGGGSPYTYSWSWASGGAGIAINTPSAQSTNFTANGLSAGVQRTGVAQCVVTDVYGQTAVTTVNVSLFYPLPPSAVASPNTENANGAGPTVTSGTSTANVTNGAAPFNYAWSWQSGGSGVTINSPTSAATSFAGTGMTPGQYLNGVALCTITDAVGQVTTTTVAVAIFCNETFTYTNQGAAVATIPPGALQMVIEDWATGGNGGTANNAGNGHGGGGGQAGGYARKTLTLSSANWGQTLNISATTAALAQVTVSSGTYTLPASLIANQGAFGGNGTTLRNGAGGAGQGTASGGDINITGANGSPGLTGGDGGAGGAGTPGLNGGPFGSGASGNFGFPGEVGGVVVSFT